MQRDISTPTIVSICVPGDYILIKDLNGKPFIFPKSEVAAIGAKLVELASDAELANQDIITATVTDNSTQVDSEGFNIDLDDLNPDAIKGALFKGLLGGLKNFNSGYPRATRKSGPSKSTKKV
jgi:hypothetical protein